MKHPLSVAVLIMSVVALATSSCDPPNDDRAASAGASTASFDSLLAEELGADEYGMHRYVMALLKAGPRRDQDSTEVMRLQRAHLNNIRRLAEAGKIVLAGPFLDGGTLRGIYIFDVASVDEADSLTRTDPAIQAGRLEMELHPWYGPAALKMVNEINETVTRENI